MNIRNFSMAVIAVIMNVLIAMAAFGYTTPAPGSLGYFLYDFLVNYIIQGPIGFVGGLFCIAFGARQLIHYNFAPSGPPYYGLSTYIPLSCFVWWLGAAAILNADSMMVSLGALV